MGRAISPGSSGKLASNASTLRHAVRVGMLAVGLVTFPAYAADAIELSSSSRPLTPAADIAATEAAENSPPVVQGVRHADFKQESPSRDARAVADQVVDSGDNRRMPFVIVDKKDARVFVFDADGKLSGTAPALLGLAVGDYDVPGIGDRPISSIRPEERTTPAGRFEAELGRNLKGKEILWVDYEGAVSLHPVVPGTPAERRQQRLSSPTPLDNRISYGCINVPAQFFENVVQPAFAGTSGIVYVIPETRPAQTLFGSNPVPERAAN